VYATEWKRQQNPRVAWADIDMKSFVNFLIKEEEKKKDEPVSKEIDTEESEEEEEETGLYGSREITSDAADIIKSLRVK